MNNRDVNSCSICKIPCFERNNYYYGKLMTTRDFQKEQEYFNEKRWLINRTVNGWGVVCGLDVETIDGDKESVMVTPGLAIDCCGREILVCENKKVSLKPEKSHCFTTASGQYKDVLICLIFHECKTEQIPISPVACDKKEKGEFNRIRDSFEIKVIPLPKRSEIHAEQFCPEGTDKEKSLHHYICDKLVKEYPTCPEFTNYPDLHCVILAEVTINGKVEIQKCHHRKLVYNNPLLYNLINCYHGDLPHVKNIFWGDAAFDRAAPNDVDKQVEWEYHKKTISWDEFKQLVDSGLTVVFDKYMDEDTINKHTFLIAAITRDETTGYRLLRYIPSDDIKSENIEGRPVNKTRFIFDKKWVDREVGEGYSAIEDGTDVEIILRGSSIFSKKGKSLDGSFKGDLPSGNGTQGSDFVTWFTVNPRRKDVT